MMRKVSRKKLSVAITTALNAGVVVGLAAPVAHAQQAAPTAATPPKIEKIEVTGSRLPSPNLESTSPISVIGAQDIAWSGITNTSDIINQLPQAFADYGSNLSNGATGTASVNLRNLGSNRTLVLVDGKRLPAGSPTYWATDLNAIPAPLIQRVEVLTGGASAIYGSDAIAGVVNFIMNDHFEGIQAQWNANGYQHNQQGNPIADAISVRSQTNPAQFQLPGNVSMDGQTQDFNLLMGGNFANGKGNATLFFDYRKSDPVLQASRNFSACASATSSTGVWSCGGSSTSYQGRFLNGETGKSYTITNAAGDVRAFSSSLDQFNFAPYNYYQRPDTRYGFNAFAHYDMFPNVRVYGEFDFQDDQTIAQIAPSGIFFGQPFTLKDVNPLLSPALKTALGVGPGLPGDVYIGRRNVEGGGRQDHLEHTDYRYVLGAKGDLFDNTWNYNFWWQSGKNVYQETYQNDFSKTRITRALDVVKDPATGKPVCASALDGTDPLCVPYDIFHTNGVTPAALAYLQTPGFQNGFTSQSVVGLQVDSDLGAAYGWRTPWAKNGAGVAFGLERRVEKLQLQTDTAFSTFDLAGQGGPTIGLDGQYTVKEAYVEARLPIIEQMDFAYLLSVNGSYRYSDYSTNHTTNSYGLGLEWAPVKDYRFRGTYQQAVRAANVIELFQAQGFNLFNMDSDPCGGPKPTATLAQCQRTGLAANKYGSELLNSPAGQYNYLQGGNPALNPETSNSYTVGLVMQPLPNLSATVDYWNIKVKDTINIIPSSLALQQCLNSGVYCDLIHRDSQGTLWLSGGGYITGTNQNLGSLSTSGIDLTLNWNQPITDYGSVGVTFIGTWLDNFINEPIPGLGNYDCAGLYGATCGTPLPVWRSKLRATWNTPWSVNMALTWRYFSSVDLETTSSNPQLAGSYNPATRTIGSQNYIDLAVAWNIDKNWSLYAGCNNIFDKDPPLLDSNIAGAPFGNGNTYPQVYDTLGRNFFLSLTAKF